MPSLSQQFNFVKNERDNIDVMEEREYKAFTRIALAFTDDEIAKLIEAGAWQNVKHEEQ